jgi:TonB family protein
VRPFAASLLIHIAGVLALLTLDFRDSGAAVEPRPLRVTLLAPRELRPALQPPPRTRRFVAPIHPPSPNAFLAPATVRTPPPPILEALPPAPVLEAAREAARPVPAPLHSLPLPPVPPPPVKTGSFGEAQQLAVVAVPHLEIKTEGFGAAQIASARLPGASLTSTAGFDSTAPAAAAPSRRSAPATAGFGDASVAAPHSSGAPRGTVSDLLPVEILFKPRPAYTEAARRLRIEGEVLLQVRFEASGVVTVLRLIQGLGHGLDESAAEAAGQIRFRPARRLETPIDFNAIVHIVFQLAY